MSLEQHQMASKGSSSNEDTYRGGGQGFCDDNNQNRQLNFNNWDKDRETPAFFDTHNLN